MARPREYKPCRFCGQANLHWEKIPNKYGGVSSRLCDDSGAVHNCKEFENAKHGVKTQFNAPKSESPKSEPKSESFQNPFSKPQSVAAAPIKPEPVSEPEVSESVTEGNPELYRLIRPHVVREISSALSDFQPANLPISVEVSNILTETQIKLDSAHYLMPDLLRLVANRKNVLLVGPAGSGKTHAASQVSEALSLPYYPQSVGPQTSKSDLIGYVDAHGKPVRSVLREAYENGGIYLLDEVDAGNAGVLTVLNAILANSQCAFPEASEHPTKGVIHKHPDFRCIAAANTFGQGANRVYAGRQQLDAATLDRFIGLDWDYDRALEEQFSQSQPAWREFVWALRRKASELNIRRVFGTRRIQQGTDLLNAGFSLERVKEMTVFFGVPTDERMKLEQR